MTMAKAGPVQPNRSVREGLEILLAVAQRGGSVGVRELARELGMTPTRVQRYLGTYAVLGMMERMAGGRYRAGPGIHTLSAVALTASGLAGLAARVLPGLADTGHIVALGVVWRETVSYLYFQQPGALPAQSVGRSAGFPARDSSIGVMLMAERGHQPPPADTVLRQRVAEAQRQGYAKVVQPAGDVSLAVAVGRPVMAGLALSGKIRDSEVPGLVRRLRETAEFLNKEMQ